MRHHAHHLLHPGKLPGEWERLRGGGEEGVKSQSHLDIMVFTHSACHSRSAISSRRVVLWCRKCCARTCLPVRILFFWMPPDIFACHGRNRNSLNRPASTPPLVCRVQGVYPLRQAGTYRRGCRGCGLGCWRGEEQEEVKLREPSGKSLEKFLLGSLPA